ncbi:MAG TPA: alkaline phytoceramidase [Candidatus Dormibacteraeota bacterium]|nr:alkaline phytoceramidase [Candidatus Dormibacteraeota bacterium]
MLSRSKAPLLLIGVALGIGVLALLLPPIPQPLSYHNFADHRGWLGIPNFGDVASNVPFAIVGLWGLIFLFSPGGKRFSDPRERWLYLFMFATLILTAFGSGYYHLAPDNARLVWDRIPIMMVFMALLAAVVAERVSVPAGLALFPIFEIVGVASVLVWRAGELRGHGDLRFYAAVQVYAILILLLALLFPPKYTRGSDLAVVVGFYALAKILEECDRQVFALGHLVSGHTLKHLAAATAGYWILRMLMKRDFAF